MKVAYCLSGFLRSYKNNDFFENMVAEVPGDVFIHTWNELVPGTPLDINEAYNFYRPAGLIVEDQFKYKQSLRLFGYEKYLQNYMCLWRSVSSAIDMASNYDIIVRFRPDMLVTSKFSKNEVESALQNKNKLYIGASDDCYYAGILTDNFAFGHRDAMKVYSKHYEDAMHFRTHFSSNERALSAYLADINASFECSDLTYKIKRMDGFLVPNSQSIKTLNSVWMNNVR